MNNKRVIFQSNFNGDRNGYLGWYDGDYVTHANWEWIGLKFWRSTGLRYYIR